MGVEKVELDAIFQRSDFITLHVPYTDQTANILSAEAIAKMKPGVRIINCARGGLVDEEALAEALKSGHVAGAALNVKEQFPNETLAVFVQPPSIEIMESRLRNRGTDSEEKILERVEKAKRELEFSKEFDVVLVNDDLEDAKKKAYKLVKNFIFSESGQI